MRFNLWLIVLLAFAPIFILFAGLTAAGGLESSTGWEVTGIVAAAAFVVAYFAKKSADEHDAEAPDEAAGVERATAAAHGDDRGVTGYSSPPCLLHEVDPSYLGYASREEVLSLLNNLLEAERAGARSAREMSALASAPKRQVLHDVAKDEARFCTMLFGHIARLGETPSRRTGAVHEKLTTLESLDERLELLNRGQRWVVRRLAAVIPKIREDSLRADLEAMLDAHTSNIDRCARLVGPSKDADVSTVGDDTRRQHRARRLTIERGIATPRGAKVLQ